MRRATRIVTVSVVAVVLAGGWGFYRVVRDAGRAENNLHAALLALLVLEDYITQHNGQWPGSWADLEQAPARKWDGFEWPRDSAKLQQHVTIDFTVNTDELVTQSVEQFNAVRPIGPCYPFKSYGLVASLLDKIRTFKKAGKTQPN